MIMGVLLSNALHLSHHYMLEVIQPGDCVIDATVGNGNDTCFLARLVGQDGKVFGFDIQKRALENAKLKLEQAGILERAVLIQDSHANILNYIHEPVKAAMFNLGYLPGGDHNITTLYSSTIKAIEGCMQLLVSGGQISICVYYGHPQGEEERIELLKFAKSLDFRKYTVLYSEFLNQINDPPIFILIQKN